MKRTHTLALARVHLTHSTHWLQHRSICLILYICSLFLVLIPRLTSYFPFLWIVPHSTHETLFRSASQQQQVKAEWNPIHLAVRINTMVVKWMWFSELYNWFHEKRMGQLKWDEDDDVKSKRKKTFCCVFNSWFNSYYVSSFLLWVSIVIVRTTIIGIDLWFTRSFYLLLIYSAHMLTHRMMM